MALADILAFPFLDTPAYLWLTFLAIVVGLLVFDLGILHRNQREIGARESFVLYSGYMAIAVLFGVWVWYSKGTQPAIEFYTGYLIEQSLSMDNVFVIAAIFGYFAIPRIYQHRVLFWGIIGVIVFRAILIGLGAALVHSFAWVLYVFGVFLVLTGIKMLFKGSHPPDIANNKVLNFVRRHFRVTDRLHGERFLVRLPDAATGTLKTYMTPLFLALILVEIADLIFAVDSVPAIFAVTTDPFIVYTSNIFAILGLRSLYFALAAALNRFSYLQMALAIVLILVGIKIFLGLVGIKVPALVALGVTFAVLGGGVVYSLWKTRNRPALEGSPG
jgi:tellurite resistance protein TerC